MQILQFVTPLLTFDHQCTDRYFTEDNSTQTDPICDKIDPQLVSNMFGDNYICK